MDNPENVPYIVYESAQARSDKRFKYMWVTILILIILLVGTNMGWIIYEAQYVETITVTQETPDGNNNYLDGNGSITNGAPNNN